MGKLESLIATSCVVLASCVSKPEPQPVPVAKAPVYDVYASERCAPLANIFKPNTLKHLVEDATLYSSFSLQIEENARIADPAVNAVSALVLQGCIRFDRGEMSSEEYTQLLKDNSARYIAFMPEVQRNEITTLIANSVKAAMESHSPANPITPATPPTAQSILAAAREVAQELYQPDGKLIQNQVVEMQKTISAELKKVVGEESPMQTQQSQVVSDIKALHTQIDRLSAELAALSKPWSVGSGSLDIEFEVSSAVLGPGAGDSLTSFMASTCCSADYRVVGFASSDGPDEWNSVISQMRATAVATAIQQRGGNVKVLVGVGETSMFGLDQANRVVRVFAVERAPAALSAAPDQQ